MSDPFTAAATIRHPVASLGAWTMLSVSLALALFCTLAGSRSPTVPDSLPPGQPGAIAVDDGRGVVDLYLSPDVPIRLLVSNLGTSDHSATLQAQATLIDVPRHRPTAIMHAHPGEPGGLSPRILLHSGTSTTVVAAAHHVGADAGSIRYVGRNPGTAAVRIARSGGPSALNLNGIAPLKNRDFWLHVTAVPLENPKGYEVVHGRLVEAGRTVEVYADSCLIPTTGTPALIQEQARDIAKRLERDVLPAISRHIGPISDPDQNGRLSVLLTPWLGRLQGGTVSVRGFVRSSDFHTDLAAPFSNHADLLYLNSDLPQGTALQTLLLHEVAHAALARHPTTDHSPGNQLDWDDWLNEGLAHLAERRCGGDWSNLDYRIARYRQSPATAPLVVRDYYRCGRWRDHGCRGATYLFLDWCEQHAKRLGVTEFTPALIATGRTGPDAIELVCQEKFPQLYRAWTIALASETSQSGNPPTWENSRSNGPRFQAWNVNQGPQQTFEVAGTATQFVEIRATEAGWHRITFQSGRLQSWQLTVIKPGQQPGRTGAACDGRLPERRSGSTPRF